MSAIVLALNAASQQKLVFTGYQKYWSRHVVMIHGLQLQCECAFS